MKMLNVIAKNGKNFTCKALLLRSLTTTSPCMHLGKGIPYQPTSFSPSLSLFPSRVEHIYKEKSPWNSCFSSKLKFSLLLSVQTSDLITIFLRFDFFLKFYFLIISFSFISLFFILFPSFYWKIYSISSLVDLLRNPKDSEFSGSFFSSTCFFQK